MPENQNIGYTRSSLLPPTLCTCDNCVLCDDQHTVCSQDYRQQHRHDRPCPRWDGGVAVRF